MKNYVTKIPFVILFSYYECVSSPIQQIRVIRIVLNIMFTVKMASDTHIPKIMAVIVDHPNAPHTLWNSFLGAIPPSPAANLVQ